jgi:hypothetical protein
MQMHGKVVSRTPRIRACILGSISHSDSRLSNLCTCDEAVPRQDTKVTTHRKCKLLLVRRRGLRCGSYLLACSMQHVCMNLAWHNRGIIQTAEPTWHLFRRHRSATRLSIGSRLVLPMQSVFHVIILRAGLFVVVLQGVHGPYGSKQCIHARVRESLL